MIKLINKLTKPFGVSGCESDIATVIEEEIKNYADEIIKDTFGNLIAVKYSNGVKDTSDKGAVERIMLAAHMDTIGIIATHISGEGYVYFSNLGGIKPYYCIGRTVEFSNGIQGTVQCDDSTKDIKDLKIQSLYIDTGLDADEVKNKINPGLFGKFEFITFTQGETIVSGYLDDRAGCAVLIETAKRIHEEIEQKVFPDNKAIYYTFTVQEEIGLRGAGPAAHRIMPDFAIVVDVTGAEDIPGRKDGNISLGKGPVIKIKDDRTISHPYIKDRLKTVAGELAIPFQLGVSTSEGTDAGAIHINQGGIMTGGLSIAARYIHTAGEMCNLKDLKNAVEILTEAVKI